jgi:GINS complex subunit 1
MYGDLATKLVLEAKRTVNLSELPMYQTDTIKEILKEIHDLDQDAQYLSQQQTEDDASEEEYKINQCQLFVTHLSMRRNKRCLLAYERLRSSKIDEFCWLNIDPGVTNISSNSTIISLDNLNHSEQEYYKNYQDLLTKYKSNFLDLDLSGDLQPPTNIFIDVRVLKNGGEVQTEYGSFNLIKNSQFYVRKSDVERLIQQGYMEEL